MIITNQVLSDKRMWDIIIFGNGAFDPFSLQILLLSHFTYHLDSIILNNKILNCSQHFF